MTPNKIPKAMQSHFSQSESPGPKPEEKTAEADSTEPG